MVIDCTGFDTPQCFTFFTGLRFFAQVFYVLFDHVRSSDIIFAQGIIYIVYIGTETALVMAPLHVMGETYATTQPSKVMIGNDVQC